MRSFFLMKEGPPRVDSRSGDGLVCEIHATRSVGAAGAATTRLEVRIANTGTATWLASDAGHGGVSLGVHLYDEPGKLLQFAWMLVPLGSEREVAPGNVVGRTIALPHLVPGRYVVELDCVAAGVTWFSQRGSRPTRLPLDVIA